MEFLFYDELIAQLKPTLDELNFKESEGGIFLKDNYAVKIDYDEERQLVNLKAAKAQEGSNLEFINLSQYLFTPEHTKRDVEAVAIDFDDTLRKELGAKKEVTRRKIDLPTKAADGETPTIEAFTKGFLDIFPQYRDAYRDNIAKNGSFHYVEFYKTYGIEKTLEICREPKNEKQLGKYVNFLNKYFIAGDKAVISVITTVLIGGSFYNNRQLFDEKFLPKVKDMNYLYPAAVNSVEYVAKHNNIKSIF